MLEKIDMGFMMMQMRYRSWKERLLHEEKGASDIVAIMVVIVVILAVAVIFQEGLTKAVNSIFDKLVDFIG